MAEIAIRAESLGKRYRVRGYEPYKALRDSLTRVIAAPVRAAWKIGRPSKATDPKKGVDYIWATKDVSFELRAGESLGLIGRNGAGKSTLLKILSRITEPTEGSAVIHGRVGSLLEVGTGFHPELTGRENVFLNGALLGMRRAEIRRKFDEIVDFSGVARFIDTPVKYYSSGMHVRLAFSVAAYLEADVLLVDEVLAVGDTEFQKKCLGRMGEVASSGRAVVLVSHNMRAIERLCSRALFMADGRVVADGPSNQVIATYLSHGVTKEGEKVWPEPLTAPGDKVARLKAVRVVDSSGQVCTEFTPRDAWSIEVEYWALESGHVLDTGLDIHDEEGNRVFATVDFQNEQWAGKPRVAGLHRRVCHIPADLMNDGTYVVSVGVSTNPHTSHFAEPDLVTVRIFDDLEPGGARGNYTREWPGGSVRPKLKWTCSVEPLEEAAIDRPTR